MQRLALAATGITVAFLLMQAALPAFSAPPYAVEGAYASYAAQGGFIPYFSGVEGNLTYTVTSVFQNGSMAVRVFENITAGTDLNPFITVLNITDDVQSPKNFPAVPLANLTSLSVKFQNVTATFLQNATISVPAGSFDTLEFRGKDANNTVVTFWFDRGSGLMVQANAGASVMELESTNIAIAVGPANLLGTEIPYELVFIIAFAAGGSLFLYMRYHYTRAAASSAKSANGKKG